MVLIYRNHALYTQASVLEVNLLYGSEYKTARKRCTKARLGLNISDQYWYGQNEEKDFSANEIQMLNTSDIIDHNP